MNNEEKKTIFGLDFIQKIILVVLTFICTTVLGTIISLTIQERNKEKELQLIKIEEKIRRAEICYNNISALLDSRSYHARRVIDSYFVDFLLAERKTIWDNYEKVLIVWNTNINRNLSNIEYYFGRSNREQLYNIWIDDFYVMHKDLQELKINRNKKKYEVYMKKIESINHKIEMFNINLLEKLNIMNIRI